MLVVPMPFADTCALLPSIVGAVIGVKMTVTVGTAAASIVPKLHCTVELTGALHPFPAEPPAVVAETNVAKVDDGRLSENVTPLTGSPVLVIVYLNVTRLPTPTGLGVTVGSVVKKL